MRRSAILLMGVFLACFASVCAEEQTSPFQILSFDEQEDPIFFDEVEEELASLDSDLLKPTQDLVESVEKKEPVLDIAKLEESLPFMSAKEEIAQEPVKNEKKEIAQSSALKIKERENKSVAMSTPPAPAKTVKATATNAPQVNLGQVFAGSPVIYTVLFSLSVVCLFIFLYNLLSLRSTSDSEVRKIRQKLLSNQFDEALAICQKSDELFSKIISAAIPARKHGLGQMLEIMKAEGKRATVGFWQRIGLLNDIAIIAPMLGLLGTVLGMFYAFYDLNRSRESVNTLFDGLGISVGTTVAGLIVAIIAMMLHSLSKYRLVRTLARVEEEAESLASLMETKTGL